MTSYEQDYKSAVDELDSAVVELCEQGYETAVETMFAIAVDSPRKVEMLTALAIIMEELYNRGFREGYKEYQTVSTKEETNG